MTWLARSFLGWWIDFKKRAGFPFGVSGREVPHPAALFRGRHAIPTKVAKHLKAQMRGPFQGRGGWLTFMSNHQHASKSHQLMPWYCQNQI